MSAMVVVPLRLRGPGPLLWPILLQATLVLGCDLAGFVLEGDRPVVGLG